MLHLLIKSVTQHMPYFDLTYAICFRVLILCVKNKEVVDNVQIKAKKKKKHTQFLIFIGAVPL